MGVAGTPPDDDGHLECFLLFAVLLRRRAWWPKCADHHSQLAVLWREVLRRTVPARSTPHGIANIAYCRLGLGSLGTQGTGLHLRCNDDHRLRAFYHLPEPVWCARRWSIF